MPQVGFPVRVAPDLGPVDNEQAEPVRIPGPGRRWFAVGAGRNLDPRREPWRLSREVTTTGPPQRGPGPPRVPTVMGSDLAGVGETVRS